MVYGKTRTVNIDIDRFGILEQIIKQLQAGETPEKQAYVEEGIYAHGSDVASVSIDGTDYEVTEVTQDVVDARAY